MGIGLAAGCISNAMGVSLFGKNNWGAFIKDPIGMFAAGSLQGSIMGAISSAVYGQNIWKGMAYGALGGVIGTGVAISTAVTLSFGASVIKDLSSFVTEKAIQAVHFIVQKTAEIIAWAGRKAVDVVGFVVDDIVSHFSIACWVKGQYGTILPVKVFNSRALSSWIPFLGGTAMNLGGEIHIPPEMFDDLLKYESERQDYGISLEDNPITEFSELGSRWEKVMGHELGHQPDADKFGPLYPILGLIWTQNPIGTFECNATERGKYYGIVPPTR